MAGRTNIGKIFVVIYLCILIGVILPTVFGVVATTKETVQFTFETDKDPLLLQEAEVKNRGTSYGKFHISEGNTLCEVVLTYQNTGWFTAEYGDTPEFYGIYEDGTEEYLGRAWLDSDADLVYEAIDENPIPAGKTGSRRYFIEIWPGMVSVCIREVSDKMEGSNADITMPMPDAQGESFSTTVNTVE